MKRAALVVLLALLAPLPALASNGHPTVGEVEGDLMCPTCQGETLSQSDAPAAIRVRAFITARIRAGDTKSQIEDKLVAQFGPSILAAPPKKGFDLLAWILPFVGVIGGAVVLAVLARRWARAREPASAIGGVPELNGRPLPPDLERRVDEELARFE